MMLAIDFLEGRALSALTLVLAAVGGAATVAAVIVAVKQLRAKRRRLSIVALAPAPLLTSHSQSVNDLSVTYNGNELSAPHVVTFVLDNYGDATIDSSCYDQSRPIRLELGVQVVEVLKVSLRPGSGLNFAHAQEATAVMLGPDVLKPAQRLTLQVLVADEPDLTSVVQEYLTNTDVEYVPPGKTPKFQPRSRVNAFLRLGPLLAVLAGGVVAVLSLVSYSPAAALRFDPPDARPGQSIHISGLGFRINDKVRIFVQCNYGIDPLFGGGSSDNYPMVEMQADSKGEFRTTAVVPGVPQLEHCRLSASQEASGWKAGVLAYQDF